MNILKTATNFVKNLTTQVSEKKDGLLQKGLLSIVAAIVFLAVGVIGFPNTASADNTVVVTLKLNATTGKVLDVIDKSGHKAEIHDPDRGAGEPHGAHIGEPIPVTIILGLKGANSGEHTTCPSGTTHVIISGTHYCL